jgi:hypothetical protein
MCEQGDVRSWVFAREVRFSADYEVGGFEVVEGGKDLWSVKSWVEWYLGGWSDSMYRSRYAKIAHQYCSKLEKCICCLDHALASKL